MPIGIASYTSRFKQQIFGFKSDLAQVLGALGWWSLVFVVVQGILGLLPIAAGLVLGQTVDALIGSRGIGVVTADLTRQLGYWLGLMLIGFLAYILALRFSDKAGAVGRDLKDLVAFGSLIVYFVTLQQYFLAVAGLIVLGFEIVSQSWRQRMLILGAMIVIGSFIAYTLVQFTVIRAFTVGEGLAMIGGIVAFIIVLKLRIARWR